ncbi:hypothetical protein QBC38DRAFT_490676 [Podospora fimiseda]|uniref:Uncharacterized protein n=1 Tax=Podospora fimiseda TaxID=252190 RepID=A0AAN7BFE1_9PEZI|nr:hypothetical protein QBC38DRAFT_490676 [Podospora fimiseda]
MPPSKRTSTINHQNQTNHVAQNSNKAPAAVAKVAADDTDSIPRNSITVASRTMPVRVRSISASSNHSDSSLSSTHSSPTQQQLSSPITKQVVSPKQRQQHLPTSASPTQTNGIDKNPANMANSTALAPRKPQTLTSSYDSSSNLDEIIIRQLEEDISAYQHDESFCVAQLEDPDLTPQETRTLQLRVLDLGHQIRHCRHRIETMQFQLRSRRPASNLRPAYGGMGAPLVSSSPAVNGDAAKPKALSNQKHPASSGAQGGVIVKRNGAVNGTPAGVNKRSAESEDADGETNKKMRVGSSPAGDYSEIQGDGGEENLQVEVGGVNTALQRLGFWKCRLCSAPKYLLAGSGRSPAAPCKWPLKDISKMITHFTEMHGEHTPSERCVELGAALTKNRGPFEYWLRRTRAQNIGDGSMLDECISGLLQGEMPILLRRHSRAAAGMPLE